MPPDYAKGKICYIEIPAIDIDASAAFYKEVFGWDVRTCGDGSTAFDDTVGQVSGTWTTSRKADTYPGILIHIMVDNMDESIESVIANGGEIVQPVGKDAPEIIAHFRDPAGNIFGLYQEPTLKK